MHEAYLRLVGDQHFDNRRHFFAAAAEAMRRILVEAARRKARLKHGGARQRCELREDDLISPPPDDRLLALDEALSQLAAVRPELAELVNLRYFAQMTVEQTAELLGTSPRTVKTVRRIVPQMDEDRVRGLLVRGPPPRSGRSSAHVHGCHGPDGLNAA